MMLYYLNKNVLKILFFNDYISFKWKLKIGIKSHRFSQLFDIILQSIIYFL